MIKEDYNEPLIREDLKNIKDHAFVAPKEVYEIVDYMDGNQSYWIKRHMAERYAIRFEKPKNDKGEQEVVMIKDDLAVKMAIESGMQEIASLGTFKKIITETATLNRNTSFKFVNEATGEEDESVSDKIRELRDVAEFDLSLGRLDELSVGVGSSVMLVQVLGNNMYYSPMSVNNVFVGFSDHVYEGEIDTTGKRVSNKYDLQEASVIVLQMDAEYFVAYFGRSIKYPQGRMVTYHAKAWDNIPQVGGEDSTDYLTSEGQPANPLTVFQDEQGDYSTPEYPLVIWRGSTTGYNKFILPITDALYTESIEQDVACSRILTAALKSARGAWHFSREQGASSSLPANIDEGYGNLEPGQTVGLLHVPGQNIKEARETVERFGAYTSESNGVPSYKLNVNVQVPSGAALLEMNKPSALEREKRYKLNQSAMSEIFSIEKALISIETGQDFGDGVEQVWIVHPERAVKTDKEVLEEAKLAKDAGIKDDAEIVKDIIDGVETREEAEEYLGQLKKETPLSNGLAGFTQRAQAAQGNATQ